MYYHTTITFKLVRSIWALREAVTTELLRYTHPAAAFKTVSRAVELATLRKIGTNE
jgi:hypothetical protein